MWIKYVSMGVRNVATISSRTTHKINDLIWEMGHLPDFWAGILIIPFRPSKSCRWVANREISDNSKLAILDLTLACQ